MHVPYRLLPVPGDVEAVALTLLGPTTQVTAAELRDRRGRPLAEVKQPTGRFVPGWDEADFKAVVRRFVEADYNPPRRRHRKPTVARIGWRYGGTTEWEAR